MLQFKHQHIGRTIEQPAAVLQSPQVFQDETGHDIIRNQLTLINTGLHQQTQFFQKQRRTMLVFWGFFLKKGEKLKNSYKRKEAIQDDF